MQAGCNLGVGIGQCIAGTNGRSFARPTKQPERIDSLKGQLDARAHTDLC